MNLIFVYSFNVCNVDVAEPWLVASDELGLDVLIVDGQGDMYFEGIGHGVDDKNLMPSFSVGDNIHFNRVTSKFSDYNDNLSVIPSDRGLEIQNSAGEQVVLFAEDGSVYTKGQGIYEGSQAGCLNDGWLYCNSDGVTRENRDYYCKITGSKTGFCDFNIVNSEDCSTKLSIDTDGGSNIWTAGVVTDYIDCSSGSCTFNTYSDVCTSSTVLREYRNQGSSYDFSLIDCTNDNYYLCKNSIDRYYRVYECSSGECSFKQDNFVETCVAPSTSYGTWSCNTITQKVRTNIVYSPTCTTGSCGVSSANVNEYDNCPTNTHCTSGSCVADTYSWVIGSWGTCSVSCGGGIQTRSVTCRRDYDNQLMSDSYCSGSEPSTSRSCNTQSCCTDTCSSLGYSCGAHTICDVSTSCGSCSGSDTCVSGVCVTPCTCNNHDLNDYSINHLSGTTNCGNTKAINCGCYTMYYECVSSNNWQLVSGQTNGCGCP